MDKTSSYVTRMKQFLPKISLLYQKDKRLDPWIASKLIGLIILNNQLDSSSQYKINELLDRVDDLAVESLMAPYLDKIEEVWAGLPKEKQYLRLVLYLNDYGLIKDGKFDKTSQQIYWYFQKNLKKFFSGQIEKQQKKYKTLVNEQELLFESDNEQKMKGMNNILIGSIFMDALKKQSRKLTYRQEAQDNVQYPLNNLQGAFESIFEQAKLNQQNKNSFPNSNYLTKQNPTKKLLDKLKIKWDEIKNERSAQDQLLLDDPLYDQQQYEKQLKIQGKRKDNLKNIKKQQNIIQTQNLVNGLLKQAKIEQYEDMTSKVQQFIQKDGQIQKRVKQFKQTLQEKLRKKKQRNLYQFQQKPWQFYNFIFDPNQISLGIRNLVFKLRYGISLQQTQLNVSLQQLNHTFIEQIKQLERKNTGAITKLFLKTEKQRQDNKGTGNVLQKRANIRYQLLNNIIKYVKTYGEVLINFTEMSQWQTQMYGSQALISPADQNQFLFKFKNGQVTVFQRDGNNVRKIPQTHMTLKFLKKNLSKKIGQQNSFVMSQFKKLDTNNKEGQNLLIKKYFT